MTRFFSAILFLLITLLGSAQDYKRTNIWYFGKDNGLSFTNNPPTYLNDGIIDSYESQASISDTNGNLLFYMDNTRVRNKIHAIMENGSGIFVDQSCTQGSIIVPQPENDSIYYIFTTVRAGGFYYSVVNTNANNFSGKVISKNNLLLTPVSEKLTAVKHNNGIDYWITVHSANSNHFYTFLLSRNGVVSCPIISAIGTSYTSSNLAGTMKFSHNGKHLAVSTFIGDKVEFFSFNASNGIISNKKNIDSLYVPYGIEFSPNDKFLYVFEADRRLFQYSIEESNVITQSRHLVYDFSTYILNDIQGLQIALDGKIYIAMPNNDSLSIIHYPDSPLVKCGFEFNGLSLNNNQSQYGLPNFVSSYFGQQKPDFQYRINCVGNIGTFNPHNVSGVQKWNIKKIGTTVSSTYTNTTAQHTFNDSGEYSVTLYTTNNDTIIKTVYIDAPILPLADTLGCGVNSVLLNVPSSYRCLQWSDTSAQFYSRTIRTNGIYTIQGYNSQGCLITDSIKINFTPSPLQPAITKVNDSLKSTPSFAYQWLLNDTAIAGANSQSIKPLVAGMYKVLITDSNGCSNVSTAYSSNVGEQELNKTSIKIYPNPAFENIIIESDAEIESIIIHDAIGRSNYEQFQTQKATIKIPCNSFAKGIYFIQVKTNNNTYRQKIIVQ